MHGIGKEKIMKRLLSAALALSLLSGTAAFAEPFDHRGGHHDSNRGRHDWNGRHHRGHDNDAGTAIAVGVGLLALTAIIASSQDRERQAQYERQRNDDYYRNDAPPPPDYRRDGPPPPRDYDE
jgi:Ni/Co efflux regulator RcnB